MLYNLRLDERLANARLLQADWQANMSNPHAPAYTTFDEKGRNARDLYHFWSGVVETYEYLVKLAAEVGGVKCQKPEPSAGQKCPHCMYLIEQCDNCGGDLRTSPEDAAEVRAIQAELRKLGEESGEADTARLREIDERTADLNERLVSLLEPEYVDADDDVARINSEGEIRAGTQ